MIQGTVKSEFIDLDWCPKMTLKGGRRGGWWENRFQTRCSSVQGQRLLDDWMWANTRSRRAQDAALSLVTLDGRVAK